MGNEKIQRTVQRIFSQDIIRIRLHLSDFKKNYKKKEEQPLRPLCEIEEDTTEHVLRCGKDIY